EVATNGGLRELHDAADLAHGELGVLEQQQDPAARGVGERAETIEDYRGASHLYIRIDGYYDRPGILSTLPGTGNQRVLRGISKGQLTLRREISNDVRD